MYGDQVDELLGSEVDQFHKRSLDRQLDARRRRDPETRERLDSGQRGAVGFGEGIAQVGAVPVDGENRRIIGKRLGEGGVLVDLAGALRTLVHLLQKEQVGIFCADQGGDPGDHLFDRVGGLGAASLAPVHEEAEVGGVGAEADVVGEQGVLGSCLGFSGLCVDDLQFGLVADAVIGDHKIEEIADDEREDQGDRDQDREQDRFQFGAFLASHGGLSFLFSDQSPFLKFRTMVSRVGFSCVSLTPAAVSIRREILVISVSAYLSDR